MKRRQIRKVGRDQAKDEEESFVRSYAGIFYDPEDPSNLRSFHDRQIFLRIAARVVPDFAQSLLLPGDQFRADWIKSKGSVPARSSAAFAQYSAGFKKLAREWARRFNIEIDWILDEAYEMVISGIVYDPKGDDYVLAFGAWRRRFPPTQGKRPFQLPAWNPRVETEPNYIARANTAWDQGRDAYVKEIKNEMLRAGLRKIPAKRQKQVAAELRFEWAALRQCAGKSINELADQYCAETEVIRISTARILKGLGFSPPT